MQNVDVAIVGGGMVGLTLACGLQGSGLRVALLEHSNPPKTIAHDAPPELRVSAINAASEKLLSYLGVWTEIVAHRASCYHGMEIWEKDSFGRIIFDDAGTGYSHLGYIVENAVIHNALWQQAQRCKDVTLVAPAQVRQTAWGKNNVLITLQSGDMITARLLVGADGANSWIRGKADIPLTFWDYRHHALVATVRTAEPHGAVARQIFHNDSILAFLPLSDPYLCSIVWSLEAEKAQHILETTPEAFNRELCMEFDNRLGLCTLESERQVFPLIGRYARQFAGHRIVLIGDAAHVIHPLAGKGVNLGFMDAAKLVDELRRLHYEGKDIGQHFYLRRYERSRKHSAAVMIASMQVFRELFAGANSAKKILRNICLKLADTLPGVKYWLLQQTMDLNNLPEWLR